MRLAFKLGIQSLVLLVSWGDLQAQTTPTTPPAGGTITIIGSSMSFATSDGKTTATLFAGRADTANYCDGLAGGDVICDTCFQYKTWPDFPIACNHNSIYSKLLFRIHFSSTSTTAFTTTSKVKMIYSGRELNSENPTLPTSGTDVDAYFKWGDICNTATNNGTDCAESFSITFAVGISKDGSPTLTDQFSLTINFRNADSTLPAFHTDCPLNANTGAIANEGVCGFTISAGDGKVFVKDVVVPNSWNTPPGSGSVKYEGVRVFHRLVSYQATAAPTQADWLKLAPAGPDTFESDLSVASQDLGLAMSQRSISELQNDAVYVFAIATYDQAGNLTNFSDLKNSALFYNDTAVGLHYGIPGEVVGLLSDKKCLIATAAFGSDMAPQVELLRKFRNQFLLPSSLGKWLVKSYYQVSPPLADFIRQHEGLRSGVRGLLRPIIWWADFCLEYGIFVGFLLVSLMGLMLMRLRDLSKTFRRRTS